MESGNGGASSKGLLLPVSESSLVFQNNILIPIKSAYLYEESKQSFRYKSAALVKNPPLEEKYSAFRAKRREVGYSEEELKESYGFLLFDDVNKANDLGETGVLTGNSTCTTLGDPSKGVYISMYSDCLDLNRWYHGKSGYIVIIRLTKGRVKNVSENYTQNLTAPTAGFDCHVSEQLPSVSAKTSSFLAFERTQYYMYELLNDESNDTAQSPSAACPFAIVSFSYTDTKATPAASPEKRVERKLVPHYLPWSGQLELGALFYDVGLRTTAGALIPAELPPVVKIDQAISMSDLRQLLPKAVFETCFAGEVFVGGLYCTLCEFVPWGAVETQSLALLLQEVKEKDLALTFQLHDGGFLILLHSSHFLTYDDTGSNGTDVLQGIFVFPVSQVIRRDTKLVQRKPAISTDILQVLPVLSYAECEVEKTPIDPGEELCEVLAQHMQSYAALINPGFASIPSREVSIFPDQYDVPDAHKHLYLSPEWTNGAWQSFRTYLSKPLSFQLPVSRASEILATGRVDRMEDLDDDVYIFYSSPEEAPANSVSMESEDQLTGQRSPVNVKTLVDTCITNAAAQVDSTDVSQNVLANDLQAADASQDTGKFDLTVLIKADEMASKSLLTPSKSDDLPAELIVSITSAEGTVTNEGLSIIGTVSATNHNDFHLSGFTTDELQTAGVNSLNDKTVTTKNILDCPEVPNLSKTQRKKLRKVHSKAQKKKVSKACVDPPSLQVPEVDDNLKSQTEGQAKESSDHPQLGNPSKIDWRKGRPKGTLKKLSAKNEKVISASVGLTVPEEKKIDPGQQSLGSNLLMELEALPLRRKTERWDLKPVISECGRILVPHGSAEFADQIRSLKDKLKSDKDELIPEKVLADASVNAHEAVESVGGTEASTSKDGGSTLQNAVDNEVNPEHNILGASDDGNGLLALNQEISDHSSKTDGKATPLSEVVKRKYFHTLSPKRIATKGASLLSKLKSVLLRGKRKTALLLPEETTADTAQTSEPCLKKGKFDTSITSVQETIMHVGEASKRLSVDPLFAYALGLTPKETPDNIQKTQDQENQQRKESSGTQVQTILDNQPQILHKPPSIFPRRGRIKMLKKHQGIPTECVKKKWWLHFQTPACYASEKLKYKESTRDKSVRKTVKEKKNSTCSSTDALNLLADLALSVSNEKVPPQPDPALERKPETSLKKCDLTKDVTSAEQESVLHALLRQPAARPMQPLECPSPSHPVGCSELVDLVSKEHAYSLPPSSSLLLGLPGTPFQVSPISGSTRLLQHHQKMFGDGINTLHPTAKKLRTEQNHRTPEYLKINKACRIKFRHSRTFANKDGSIQVTKHWKENYDFDLDSKFTNDSKDRTIIRALHGPWDFSIEDTSEEVRLIVHMWIGLFYSRSTDRFFNIELCPEESGSLEMSCGMVSATAQPELTVNSLVPLPSVTKTADTLIPNAMDLSKKDDSVLRQGSVILDLSMRNSSAEIVTSDSQNRMKIFVSSNRKDTIDTLNPLKSSAGQQKTITTQCYKKMVQSTMIVNEMNDFRRTRENMTTSTPLQKDGTLEHNVLHIFQGDGTYIPAQEMKLIFFQPENDDNAPRIGHLLFGCKNDKSKMIDGICNSETTGISLIEKHGKDFYKSVRDIEVDLNNKACDVVPEVEHDEMKAIQRKKETPCQESNEEPSPKVINTNDDSTKKESGIVCNGSLVENEKPLSRKEVVAVSPGKDDIVKEDMDCSKVHKGKVIEDASGKGIGLDQKDSCVSAVVSLKDCIEECSHKPPLVEQQPEANHENDSALSGENAMSENTEKAQLEIKSISKDLAVEDNSEIDISLADKAHYQMALSPRSDEKNSIVDGSNADGPIPLTKDQCKNGSNNRVLANLTPSSHTYEDQDTNSIEAEQKVVDPTEKELFPHQSQSPQREAEVALIKETDVNQIFIPNEGLEKIYKGIVIPFIGIDTSQEDAEQPHNSSSLGNIKEVVKEGVPMIYVSTCPETVLPTGVCSTSKINSKKAELYAEKVSGSESDDRCPTPTMDETPYQHPTGSGPRSSSVTTFCGSETSKNMTPKCHSRKSLQNEMPNRSTVHSDAKPHNDLDPDVERRTLRVLKSIHKYFSKSNYVDTSSQVQTADKHSPNKTPNLRSKYIPSRIMPSHTSSDFEDKKMSNKTSTMTSASTSQELHKDSTAHILIAPFKSKLEEVLGVKLQLQETESSVQRLEKMDKLQETSIGPDMCHPSRSVPSTESLQDINQYTDQDEHNTTSKTNLSQEPRSYSQRPIMAVKPSKSDESKGDFISKDKQIENTVRSHFFAINTMFLEKKTESLKRTSEGLNDKQGASELPPKRSLLSSVSDREPKSDKEEFILLDSFDQHQGSDMTQFNRIPSPSLPVHSCDSEQNSSGLVDGNQGFMTNVVKIGQATKQSIEMYQKNCSNASTSDADYKQCGVIDDSLSMGPNSSLMCTVNNSSQERSPSFLEQVSQRCIQDDPTEASMEKECLIFSEQMKLLLKRKNREPICQQDTHDKVNLSCVSPMTVHFSSLEEQEDYLDPLAHLDAPSFIGHQIKVDLSERKDLAVSAEEGSTLHPQKLSQETDNPMKHPGISGLKSEYARLYKAMMNEVCDANKVSSRPKHFRMDRGYSKTEPSNHFDFCDQMKREMDESFRSNLNSVVKKSCKTKYRFYIIVTSEDDFFEETKVQLESEGHTAVQPTEFFLGEDCHSSLLIILRNEDIAEHICEVPHLLELRKSPVVQFAGIDEPDDVLNLTHQEVFTRGGFIMFDRAGLEHLNLCNIKKTSEVLQELSKTGKWKWMLHYRDSRWLKENARLSLEGKEKQNFLNCCQEAGIVEVLPYHECDLMSRDGPDYLACLVRLQVQNISARYPVFITDTTADNAFGKKGILTMTFDSFLTYSPSLTRTA
ncbi:uncharacterized protein tasor2 isoform X1 [Trematomus bernacchii]|uniref:uncharacterized protein tasor2 isoform X1 n=1 Tax=Trematomus bernacchii TaxID=40690 RepID=UPI00146C7149|nr:uncharacterized protein tasor2 isoform X1 [Trematomus bernacchii]